jgi:hypothetical protein
MRRFSASVLTLAMSMTRYRLAALAALSALALLVLPGCSSGGTTSALTKASTAPPSSPPPAASQTYASKDFMLPLTVTVDASLKSPPVDFTTFLTWDAAHSSSNKVRFLVPTNLYRPGSFISQAPPKHYLKYLRGLTSHGVKLFNVVKITVDGHRATLMTAASHSAAGPPGFFDGTIGCADPADDQEEACLGFQPEMMFRIAVIPVGNTTLLAWARTSKAHPDETFFAIFERMLKSVRFRTIVERSWDPAEVHLFRGSASSA